MIYLYFYAHNLFLLNVTLSSPPAAVCLHKFQLFVSVNTTTILEYLSNLYIEYASKNSK